jgi:hypothetical protein
VIGAYAMLFGRNRVRVANPQLALWLNALWLVVAWVLLQLLVGITFETCRRPDRGRRPCRRLPDRPGAGQAAADPALPRRLGAQLGFEQPVKVDDDIFHLGIVDRALGIGAPGVERAGVIGEQPDQVTCSRSWKSSPCGSFTRPPNTRCILLIRNPRFCFGERTSSLAWVGKEGVRV